MSDIRTGRELAAAGRWVAEDFKTLYVNGAFGWPMTFNNKARAISEHKYNQRLARTAKINAATADTFGFDCVCLIKALLWGWSGDKNKSYGGAVYEANGVPEQNEDTMISRCSEVSADFSRIDIGEVVWLKGHIGVYIGDGLAVECTPSWDDGVQITAVGNMGAKAGYHTRTWTKHGKLPYITYTKEDELDMTKKEFLESLTAEEAAQIVEKANGFFETQAPPDWARGEIQEAVDMGVTDGTYPMRLSRRYETMLMTKRVAARYPKEVG